ncbi:MAG: glycosyl transferase [Dehalococcoidia bacterium]|nr:glycosyl transferase [Dehalococcoidia bacterium]
MAATELLSSVAVQSEHKAAPAIEGCSISVIIPSWNGAHLLPGCLDAVARQTCRPAQVIVVDDGSTDDTVAVLRSDYPWVLPLVLAENGGFARAVNAGLRAASGEVAVLLNNDAEPEPEWLDTLCAPLLAGADDMLASCASKISLADRPGTLHSAGDGYGRDGVPSNRGVWTADSGRFDQQEWVFGPCAAAAAYRRDVVLAAGGFDEWLGMYCEDVDLAWRLQLRGYRCLYVPEARVHHRLSATGGGSLASYFCGRNFLLVAAMNLPGSLLRRYWWRLLAAQVRIAAEALWHSHEPAARARLRGQWAGLRALPAAWRRRQQRQDERRASLTELDALLT